MELFLMSPPSASWSLRGRANFRSERAHDVDPQRARLEWLALAEGIEALGGRVAVLAPNDALSGLPYAAEAGHPLPRKDGRRRFLLPRMKPVHRQGEAELWQSFVTQLGFDAVSLDRGVWEGQGDVATFGRWTFLFLGGRTDDIGFEAARTHFEGEVLPIRIRQPAFHGNMALLPLDHVRGILVCADVVDDDSLALLEATVGRDRMHFVSEEEIQCYAANGLPVGDTVLAPTLLPERVKSLMERLGMKVAQLDMSELCDKAGGASRCLVCRVPDADDIVIPDEHALASYRHQIRIGL